MCSTVYEMCIKMIHISCYFDKRELSEMVWAKAWSIEEEEYNLMYIQPLQCDRAAILVDMVDHTGLR